MMAREPTPETSDYAKTSKEIICMKILHQCHKYYQHHGNQWPGSVVGIATGYGLYGPGIESRWRRDFPHLSRPDLGPTQPPV
jgi:hypothetical protein